MKRTVTTEDELRQFEDKVRRIKQVRGAWPHAQPGKRDAGSNPAPTPKPYAPYRNKLEYNFAAKCDIEKRSGLILDWGYETQTFMLSKAMNGKRGDYHRNDFVIQHLDRTIEMAQTKGWHKNLSASMKSLRWAAQKHPWYTWTVWQYHNGWVREEVRP
jgi:hypothetical protein